jgi:hypothetical protein
MIFKTKTRYRLSSILFIGLLIYSLYWLFLGAYYSHPNAEDILLGKDAQNMGVFNYAKIILISHDGRYFTNLLNIINPLYFNCLNHYWLVIVFSIFLFWFSIGYFLASVFQSLKKTNILVLSAVFLVINFALSSSIAHQLYWLSSSFVYLYSWMFWLLWVGSVLFYLQRKNIYYFILANVFLFVGQGINEMFLSLNFFTVLFLVFYFSYKNTENFKSLFPLFISFIASSVLFISSPGILVRFSEYNEKRVDEHGVFDVIWKSILDLGFEMNRMFLGSFLLISAIIFLIINKHTIFNIQKKNQNLKVIFVLCISVPIIYLMSMSYYLTMGHYEPFLPLRIFSAINTGIVILFLCSALFFSFEFLKIKPISQIKLELINVLLITVFGLELIFGNNNISLLRKEFNEGIITGYDIEMKERYSKLAAENLQKNCWKTVELSKLQFTPQTIYHGPDIRNNRYDGHWNQAYENYFEMNEVRLNTDTLNKKQQMKIFLKQ